MPGDEGSVGARIRYGPGAVAARRARAIQTKERIGGIFNEHGHEFQRRHFKGAASDGRGVGRGDNGVVDDGAGERIQHEDGTGTGLSFKKF